MARSAPRSRHFGGDWDFFFYELDSNDPVNWAGFSEISCLDNGDLMVIERNQGIGIEATLNRRSDGAHAKARSAAEHVGTRWSALALPAGFPSQSNGKP